MLEIATFMLVVAVAFATVGLLALALKIGSMIKHAYRRQVWRTALYIAEHRQDLLAEVKPVLAIQDTVEVEVVSPHTQPIDTIQTAPRQELEEHVAGLETTMASVHGKWLDAVRTAEELEAELQTKDMLRERYLKRLRRVDAALAEGDDVFAALHPALARMAA